MISIKALMAISLTGLGAAAMGADAYLASHHPVAARVEPVTHEPLLVAMTPETPEPSPVVEDRVVTLDPVTIYARTVTPRRVARKAPERVLVPCSEWRSLESGPAGHQVQRLCYAPVAP